MTKVLWFTNVEVDYNEIISGELNNESRGWMSTLAGELCKDVELHIVSISLRKRKPIRKELLSSYFVTPRYAQLRMFKGMLYGYKNLDGDVTSEMMSLVSEIKPDIVHIHGSEKQFIRLVQDLNNDGIPVLVSIQGIVSVIAKKFVAGYSESFIRRYFYEKGFKKNAFLPRTQYLLLKHFRKQAILEERIFRQVPFFAGRTHWDRSIVSLLNPNAKYFHIDRILKPIYYENCWDVNRPDDEPYIIHTTTGNSVYKGFEVIAEAAYLLEQSGFSFNWRIAGLAEKDWSVKAAKRKLGSRYPQKSLIFLGKVSALKLVESMLAADQYVSASHIENSPNNLAEAMMLGLPCIATDVGGTSTYLDNNTSGMLIPEGDPHALAGCVHLLAGDKEKRKRMGEQARQVSMARHDRSNVKSAILGAYRKISAQS